MFILILLFYAILGFKKPGIAVVTVPVVCLLLAYAAAWLEVSEAIVFAPTIFVATLIAVLVPKREPDSERWPQRCAKWMLISFIVLLLFVTGIAVLSILPSFGFLALILFICTITFMATIISYGLTSRHTITAYIISTIGSSMRQNLPLPMALESAASGQRNRRSRILQNINKWLVQGYSLSESIKRGYPKCPGYAVAMIAAAERINQLPLAIRSIEADMAAKAEESKKIEPVYPFYPMVLVGLMCFIVWGLMTFVMPQFISVLEEMVGAALPAPTRLLVGIASFIAWEAGTLFLIVFAFIICVLVPTSIYIKFRPRRPQQPYLISRIGDFVKWHLPVLHWFENNYSQVQTVEMLRLSLNAGCTVNDAIANTLSLDVNTCFRKRLQKWLAKVEVGDNIAAAVRESRLSNTLAWAFDEQVNQGNTLTILETLESFYRLNYSYRVNLVRFIMCPCVTIIMGAMVGFVVYAVFSPGISIIHHMADLVTP